jgi:thioredoxin 1
MSESRKEVQHVNDGDFDRLVLKSSTPAVVDFYADWCGPCRMVSPIIESLSKEYNGRVTFAKIDTDANQDLAARYDIMSIPTVMIFRNGQVVDKVIGAVPAQVYKQRIESALRAN